MRVKIDSAICQGHAMCYLACPEIFKLDEDDGHAYVENELVPEGFEDAVDHAQRGCPEGAITIFE